MQCPSCKEQIDNDSRYCDQCGEQLMVCSVCGRPGKGKRCIFDGNELVLASGGSTGPVSPVAGSVSTPAPPVQPVQSPQSTQSPLPVQPVQIPSPVAQPVQVVPITPPGRQVPPVQPTPQSPALGDKVKLTSQIHGITIDVQDGDIIGRKNGAFANVFNRFNYVSGTHCKIVKTSAGWHIQDMGSTNKTFYNGSPLVPNALYPIVSGTTVKIADIELLITYDTAEGGTARL